LTGGGVFIGTDKNYLIGLQFADCGDDRLMATADGADEDVGH
jgi:hypothetical protein